MKLWFPAILSGLLMTSCAAPSYTRDYDGEIAQLDAARESKQISVEYWVKQRQALTSARDSEIQANAQRRAAFGQAMQNANTQIQMTNMQNQMNMMNMQQSWQRFNATQGIRPYGY